MRSLPGPGAPQACGDATGPIVAAIDMGLGHLRAAQALADELGDVVVEVDRPPVAEADEQNLWLAARRVYEVMSRGSQVPLVGAPVRSLLHALTAIPPLHPDRDLSPPTRHCLALDRLIRSGLGRGLAAHSRSSGRRVVATHFSPALSAAAHGCDRVDCIVTDADISRAWAPLRPQDSLVRYLVPSQRARRRLVAYGVRPERVVFTGFPLPGELVGGPDLVLLRERLAARLVRLDPAGHFVGSRKREIESIVGALPERERGKPPTLTFAIGGAGAQADLVRRILPSLSRLVRAGRLRLNLVAGLRAPVASLFSDWLDDERLGDVEGARVILACDFLSYYRAFNAALATTDVLWTKPSELTFYGALGLPLVLAQPVGVHEAYNRRWARERGAGLAQRDPRHAGQWLVEWLEEGVLAAAAWAGHAMMPSAGTYRIAEAVSRAGGGAEATLQVLPA